MKFIATLTPEEWITLTDAYHHHPVFRVRQRAHALLLNARGYKVAQLREWFETRHETVSSWLDRWEAEGITGLFDQPRRGRPATFTEEEAARFIGYIDENPHQPRAAAARLQEETGKEASPDTFKRLLKKKTTVGNVADNPPVTNGMKPFSSGIVK